MVFVMEKREIEELEKLIKFKGYSCVSIHGDKGQK
jgi:superfamily II DNA/RNA helicase